MNGLIKLKEHVIHTSLQVSVGIDLRKKLPLFRSKDIAFVLKEHIEESGSVKLFVFTSTGNLGWVNSRDVEFI